MRLHSPERTAEYVAAGWWHDDASVTWDSLLRARVAERPDAVAVVDPLNREALLGSPPRRLTWAEVDAEVDRLAAGLATHGIGVDDVVGTQLPNTVELVIAYLALARIGAIVSPFPMPYREHELGTLGAVAGLAAMITVGSFGGRELAAAAAVTGAPVFAFGAELPAGVVALDALPPGSVPRLVQHSADVVTLCWTSGTESVPKGVPRCANGWAVIGRACAAAPALTADDVVLSPFPLVNMAGFGGVFVPWLVTGARLVQHHPFDLPTFLAQVAQERVSYTLAPPALLAGMLAAPGLLEGADLSSLRVIGSGSAPLPDGLVRAWQERFGIEITNFFGSNEGTPLVSDQHTVPDPDDRARYFPWFGGPGLRWANPIADGVRTRLVDPASDTDITAVGVPGELRVAGPTIMSGYWGGVGEPFDEQGYYRTGDLFAIAGSGRSLLRYVDRLGDIVIRGGANISPTEVEELLRGHPDVADVAVVGVPDELLGERVAALVVARHPQSPPGLAELVEWLRAQRIASYKLPEHLAVVDELPRNALGKVLRRELRERLAARSDDQP